MINGIKTTVDGDCCAYCDAKVIEGLYNFCPKCGNPLNVDAIRFQEQQIKKVEIDLLDEIAYRINDKDSLNVILQKIKEI